MIHYHCLGSVPPKHHVTHYENGKLLLEQSNQRMALQIRNAVKQLRKDNQAN